MKTLAYHNLSTWIAALVLGAACGRSSAVNFHVTTALELKTALTLAAASSANNNICVTNSYNADNSMKLGSREKVET